MPVFLRTVGSLSVALFVLGCGGSGAYQESDSRVSTIPYAPLRFFNGFGDKIPANLSAFGATNPSADGKSEATYGEALRYNVAPTGVVSMSAQSALNLGNLLSTMDVDFDANRHRTLIGFGKGSDRKLLALSDEAFTDSIRSTVAVNFCDLLDVAGTHIGTIEKDGVLVSVSSSQNGGVGDGVYDLGKGPGTYVITLRKPINDLKGPIIAGPFSFQADTISPLRLIVYGSGKDARLAVLPGVYVNL